MNNKQQIAISLDRTNSVSLDSTSIFNTLSEACAYVCDRNTTAYPGQIISALDDIENTYVVTKSHDDELNLALYDFDVYYSCSFVGDLYVTSYLYTLPIGTISFADESYRDLLGKTVILPSTIKTIGDRAFFSLSSDDYKQRVNFLSKYVIPTSVRTIGQSAFYRTYLPHTLVIPPRVTEIGSSCFCASRGLNSVNIQGPVKIIKSTTFSNCSDLETITLPQTVTHIEAGAFQLCKNLTKIELPKSLISIGQSAFSGCDSLTNIVMPEGVTTIGMYAFSGCDALKHVTISDNIISIGKGVFLDCNNLEYNNYDNGCYLGNDKNPHVLLVKAMSKDISNVVIHDDTKFIHSSAFKGCSSLTSVTIGNSVTSIGESAFEDCSSLMEISFEGTMSDWDTISIGEYAFYGVSATFIKCIDGVITID